MRAFLLVLALLASSCLEMAAAQGLQFGSYNLGADNRLQSQAQAWAQAVKKAKAVLDSWSKKRAQSRPCASSTPAANLCGAQLITEADATALLVASSPEIYDTRVTSHTGGVYIAPSPQNQLCNACVAYAMAAAAQSAAAVALQQSTSTVPFPSPFQLFFCNQPAACISNNCVAGWQLQEAVVALVNSKQWAANGLISNDCMPMSAVDDGTSCADQCNMRTCGHKFPSGNFSYTNYYPLQDIWQVQQHIRQYGAAVITRMTLPADFKYWFNASPARRKAVYDNPKASSEISKSGSATNHAVVLAGYNNVEQYWIIWSSWGKDWADGGFARVRYHQLGLADPQFTIGVKFQPSQTPASRLQLRPASQGKDCFWYKAQLGDYLSAVANKLKVDQLQTLIEQNAGVISSPSSWLQEGQELLVCGSGVRSVYQNDNSTVIPAGGAQSATSGTASLAASNAHRGDCSGSLPRKPYGLGRHLSASIHDVSIKMYFSTAKAWIAAYRLNPNAACRKSQSSLCAATDSTAQAQAQLLMATSPLAFDARRPSDMGGFSAVGPVKNQKECGTSVSFAVLAAAQSAMACALKHDATSSLSEQDFFFCKSVQPGKERTCSSGMSMGEGVDALVDLVDKGTLPVTQTCLQYNPAQTDCNYICHDTDPDLKRGRFNAIKVGDQVWKVQEHIRLWGSVIAALDVYDDFTAFFADNPSGIYQGPGCGANFNFSTAIQLVGYNIDSTPQYWIARNSWGTGFAAGGFFKIKIGTCRVGSPQDTYGLKFIPNNPLPKPYDRLSKSSSKPGCYDYRAQPSDYISKVATTFGLTPQQVLLDNKDVIPQPDMYLTGITLVLCGISGVP